MARGNDIQYFRIFFDASLTLLSSESLKDILKRLVKSTVNALGVKAGALMLLNEKTDNLELVSSHLLSRKYLSKGPLSSEKSIPEVLEGRPVFIKNAFEDSRVQYPEAMREEGINSILSVPVVARDKVIGVLRLYSAEPRDFSEKEMGFVSALAEMGGLAIANARIYENQDSKLQDLLKKEGIELPKPGKRKRRTSSILSVKPVDPSRSLEYFRALHEVTRSILSALDSRGVMNLIVARVHTMMNLKGCALRLVNETTRELELLASSGLSSDFLGKGPLHADRSIRETLEGAPVLVADARNDSSIEYPEKMAQEGIVSILSLPIVARERVIGILRLYAGETRYFSQDEIAFLQAIAGIAGIAIRNVRLYEKTGYDLSFWTATLAYFQAERKS